MRYTQDTGHALLAFTAIMYFVAVALAVRHAARERTIDTVVQASIAVFAPVAAGLAYFYLR